MKTTHKLFHVPYSNFLKHDYESREELEQFLRTHYIFYDSKLGPYVFATKSCALSDIVIEHPHLVLLNICEFDIIEVKDGK